eukprot:TRINITY_DN7609_c0_g1_i1.p1 TRINITY_DN7609_c0_g1~~TRINITY_DN7609_c0_g1_i1.p1  ORF type:complete len:599 (-),score=101.11 TRINITY_DN7609_c0_g1_i1:773-2389(-)
MADMQDSAVGHESSGAPGSSMHGVTGKEALFGFSAVREGDSDEGLFAVPVDSEHKSKVLRLYSFAQPHMRAFHLSWFSFFIAFCSAFAAPPLVPIIRDNLNLQKKDIGNASITSVIGAVVSRILIGSVCDLVGPRYGAAVLLMTTVPCTLAMAVVSDATSYIIVRLFIGFALATFVTCQYWVSSMFNSKIVGLCNGVAAGWGNMGGGAIQLIMPYLQLLIQNNMNVRQFMSWRLAFFVPGVMQMVGGLLVLSLGQDCPDGQYSQMAKSGQRKVDSLHKVLFTALLNYRTYIMLILYGYCFGVELTVDNNIANYFSDQFNLKTETAGLIAASFGMCNLFSRPSGGLLSDLAARSFGMRGRLWVMWFLQFMGGVMCFVLGHVSGSLSVSIIVLVIFSYFVQAACGGVFGVVPFVSRRSLGIVSGLTGAGGNTGSAVTQALFFTTTEYTTQEGFQWMGVLIMCISLLAFALYFPQWGGMVLPASKSEHATEENYYGDEYNGVEKDDNMHANSMKFAANARSERGRSAAREAESAYLKGDNV